MKLGLVVSEWRRTEDTYQRWRAEKLGVVLAQNGIYHAVIREEGQTSPVLEKEGVQFYVIKEDLETRGFTEAHLADSKVKVITYVDLVDLIMNEYEKFVWL